MNCLIRSEIQEYIDKTLSVAKDNYVSNHISNCNVCRKEYHEMIDDLELVHKSLGTLVVKPKQIPSIETYINSKRTNPVNVPFVLRMAAALFFILITLIIGISNYHQPKRITEEEWIVNNFLIGTDPNKQWHENQMIITITNSENELVHSFVLDNND